jgi:polygalacturonase
MYDIRNYGAVGDGAADNSAIIKALLQLIDADHGGVLHVPAGIYLTGPLELPDNATLQLDAGATLRFIPDLSRYHPVSTRWEGIICKALQAPLFAQDAHDIVIEGEGTIDGSGPVWWKMLRDKRARKQSGPESDIELRLASLNGDYANQPSGGGGRDLQFLRPSLVQFLRCRDIAIRDVTLANSPMWTLHPVFCDRVEISGVHIVNPADAPNTDGMDIDSCTNVTISDSTVDVGDDCIALKAGAGEQGYREARPTAGVRISGCRFNAGHGGIVMGSETAGSIRDVTVTDCAFNGTDRGVRIKSRRGRGGTLENLSFSRLKMKGVLCPISINLYYSSGSKRSEAAHLFSLDKENIDELTPRLRNIHFSQITAVDCRVSAGFIVGLPEAPIDNITIEDCRFTIAAENLVSLERSEMFEGIAPQTGRGILIKNANGRLRGISLENCADEAVVYDTGADFAPCEIKLK